MDLHLLKNHTLYFEADEYNWHMVDELWKIH